jgi:hypothetical protein
MQTSFYKLDAREDFHLMFSKSAEVKEKNFVDAN